MKSSGRSMVAKKLSRSSVVGKPASGKLETGMIKDVPSGVVLRVKPTTPEHRLGPFPIEKFKYEPIKSKNIRWSQSPPMPEAIDEKFPEDPAKVLPLFRQIRDCLVQDPKSGNIPLESDRNDQLTFAHANSNYFQALPTCAALGQSFEDIALTWHRTWPNSAKAEQITFYSYWLPALVPGEYSVSVTPDLDGGHSRGKGLTRAKPHLSPKPSMSAARDTR